VVSSSLKPQDEFMTKNPTDLRLYNASLKVLLLLLLLMLGKCCFVLWLQISIRHMLTKENVKKETILSIRTEKSTVSLVVKCSLNAFYFFPCGFSECLLLKVNFEDL
jgi:hypothetical protein